jgi:hypothetical protein
VRHRANRLSHAHLQGPFGSVHPRQLQSVPPGSCARPVVRHLLCLRQEHLCRDADFPAARGIRASAVGAGVAAAPRAASAPLAALSGCAVRRVAITAARRNEVSCIASFRIVPRWQKPAFGVGRSPVSSDPTARPITTAVTSKRQSACFPSGVVSASKCPRCREPDCRSLAKQNWRARTRPL